MAAKTTKTDTAEKPPHKAAHASETASAEALEQAAEYSSLFAPTPLALDDGEVLMIPPHPDYGMIDDDKVQEYEELRFAVDTLYDREDDIFIPEQRIVNAEGKDTGVTLPSSTQRGALKTPYRINGELVRPPYPIRIAQLALGEVDYKRLREGGRNASDVWTIWNQQSLKIRERQQRDSKSAVSTVGVEAVPATDSE